MDGIAFFEVDRKVNKIITWLKEPGSKHFVAAGLWFIGWGLFGPPVDNPAVMPIAVAIEIGGWWLGITAVLAILGLRRRSQAKKKGSAIRTA